MARVTRFSLEFSGQLCIFYSFFFFLPFTPASLTESCSFWYGLKYLFPCTSFVKTDVVKIDTRDMYPHGRLRGCSAANGLTHTMG